MANVNSKLASLLTKLQDRLNRVSSAMRQNVDAIATKIGGLETQTFQRDEQLREKLNELGQEVNATKKENDDREARQTLRDQNNVQSIMKLRDSTQKGFDQVRQDVESLLKAVQRLNERVGQAESQGNANVLNVNRLLGSVAKMEVTQAPNTVWVNKKLTGVYDTTDELDKRIQELEQRAVTPVKYLGYDVRVKGSSLVFTDLNGTVSFPFHENIANLVTGPYGVIVTVKSGGQYIVCGGSSTVTMYVNLFKKAR